MFHLSAAARTSSLAAAALVAEGRSRSEGFAAVRSLRGAGEGGTGAAHPVAVAGAARECHTQDIARSLEAGRPGQGREAAGADYEAAAGDRAEGEDKTVVDENVAGYELG